MNKNLSISKASVYSFLALIIFKFILDFGYVHVVSDVWGYMRLDMNLNIGKLIESYLLLFIVFIFMPKSYDKLSNVIVNLLIIMSYVPMTTIYALKDESSIFMYAVTVFWLMVFFCPAFLSYPFHPSGNLESSISARSYY
jgi:hypothetical protein